MTALVLVPYAVARDLLCEAYNRGTELSGWKECAEKLHDATIPPSPETWTTTRPGVAGAYWVRRGPDDSVPTDLEEVREYAEAGLCLVREDARPVPLADLAAWLEWLGPLHPAAGGEAVAWIGAETAAWLRDAGPNAYVVTEMYRRKNASHTTPIYTTPQPVPAASDYPECSSDPASCPENEGFGCCKPNPTVPAASGGDPQNPRDDSDRYCDECPASDLSVQVYVLLGIIDEACKSRDGQLWYPKGRSRDEQNWQAERNESQRAAIEEARSAIERYPAPSPAPLAAEDEADMFWDDDDPEMAAESITEIITHPHADQTPGTLRRIQRAVRLSDVLVRVVEVTPEGCDPDIGYEVVAEGNEEIETFLHRGAGVAR